MGALETCSRKPKPRRICRETFSEQLKRWRSLPGWRYRQAGWRSSPAPGRVSAVPLPRRLPLRAHRGGGGTQRAEGPCGRERDRSRWRPGAGVATDVSQPESVEQMAATVKREFGRIDILVNNAGIFSTIKMRPFEQIPLEEWEQVMRVNITGVMLCCRAVTPSCARRNGAASSTCPQVASRSAGPTTSTIRPRNRRLIGMTRSMARELGPHGITVNAILPGPVFTEIPRETVTPEQKKTLVAMQSIPRPRAQRSDRHNPFSGLGGLRLLDRTIDYGRRRCHLLMPDCGLPSGRTRTIVEREHSQCGRCC